MSLITMCFIGVTVLDEAEYALLRELKQLKKDYQTKFEARKQTHTEVTYLEGLVTQSKLNLARSFLDWYCNIYARPVMSSGLLNCSHVTITGGKSILLTRPVKSAPPWAPSMKAARARPL